MSGYMQSPPNPRLAVLGDVHANWPALDAVLTAIDAHGLTDGVVTGDLVLRGAQPERCVTSVAERGWRAVAGNTDVKVATRTPRPAGHSASARVGSRSWTHHALSARSLAYLRDLPLTHELRLGEWSVRVAHASPDDPRTSLFDPLSPDSVLRAIAATLEADVVVTGHTHWQMARTVAGCLFLNPGSVGESLGEDRCPRWAWLEAGPSGPVAHLEVVDAPLARLRLAQRDE